MSRNATHNPTPCCTPTSFWIYYVIDFLNNKNGLLLSCSWKERNGYDTFILDWTQFVSIRKVSSRDSDTGMIVGNWIVVDCRILKKFMLAFIHWNFKTFFFTHVCISDFMMFASFNENAKRKNVIMITIMHCKLSSVDVYVYVGGGGVVEESDTNEISFLLVFMT